MADDTYTMEAAASSREALRRVEQLETILSGMTEVQMQGSDGYIYFVLGKQGGHSEQPSPPGYFVYSYIDLSSNLHVGVDKSIALLFASVANSNSGISLAAGGLTDPDDITDAGWIPVASTDNVWLEISVAFAYGVLYPTAAQICTSLAHGPSGKNYVGGQWVAGGDLENDGGTPPTQTYARILLARVNGGELTQLVRSNLAMANFYMSGEVAIYPILA